MRRLRGWLVRLWNSLASRGDEAFADELEAHLELHIADNIRRGLSPAEARRQAVVSLGGIEQTRERYRDQRGLPLLDTLRQDVTYAVRILRRDAAFTLTAVLTLALGIGANSAVFSAINAALLRPLAFEHPERLVMMFAANSSNRNPYDEASYPAFLDWKNRSRSFESMAAVTTWNVTVLAANGPAYAHGRAVTANAFDVLGTHAAIGGDFRGWLPGSDDVVVLSYGFWNRLYGGRPAVGEQLRINGRAYAIVGVMPDTFWIESRDEDFYVPMAPDARRNHEFVRAIGRLRPSVTLDAARREMRQIAAQLSDEYPRESAGAGVTVIPLADALARNVRGGLVTMLGVVGVLLIIACTNVAGLLLARGVARQRELSVRAALGAGRARLARQLLTESVLIALAGGAAGLLLAAWVAHALGAALADQFHVARLADTVVDARVVMFTAAVSLATGVGFGTLPAFASVRQLNWNARTAELRVGQSLVHRSLVVAEIALALVLLAGAGTLLKTFVTLRQTRPGFEPARLLHVDLRLPQPSFAVRAERAAFYASALERVRAVPGVESAALVSDLPLNTGMDHESFHITGRPDPSPDRQFRAAFNLVSSAYFRTMGIAIEQGREFADSDGVNGAGVVVINRTAAQTFWPGMAAVGQQIVLPITADTAQTLTVVGVVGDVKQSRLSANSEPEVFVSAMQTLLPWSWMTVVARARGVPSALAHDVQAALHEANPQVPVVRVSTLQDVVATSMTAPRTYMVLLGSFALLGLALASIGLYGLLAYTTSQRTRELGLRAALGATAGDLLRLVITQGLGLTLAGASIGLIGGLVATRLLVSLTDGIEPYDPITHVGVASLMIAVALTASYVPARRAARVDPMAALRTD